MRCWGCAPPSSAAWVWLTEASKGGALTASLGTPPALKGLQSLCARPGEPPRLSRASPEMETRARGCFLALFSVDSTVFLSPCVLLPVPCHLRSETSGPWTLSVPKPLPACADTHVWHLSACPVNCAKTKSAPPLASPVCPWSWRPPSPRPLLPQPLSAQPPRTAPVFCQCPRARGRAAATAHPVHTLFPVPLEVLESRAALHLCPLRRLRSALDDGPRWCP